MPKAEKLRFSEAEKAAEKLKECEALVLFLKSEDLAEEIRKGSSLARIYRLALESGKKVILVSTHLKEKELSRLLEVLGLSRILVLTP